MTKMRWTVAALGVVVFCLSGAAAQAQATRTWVSGVGDDANPCSRTAPCKTFAGAISKTAAGGEISVLDPGGFGAVTITKAITISGDGTLASILASGTNGVIVNAGVNDRIILRNLSINGAGTGLNGIRFLAGRMLRVEKCSIYGFTNNGIDVVHTSTGNAGQLAVVDSSISNITLTAIRLDKAVGATDPTVMVDRSLLNRNKVGVDIVAGLGTISNSEISQGNQAIVAEGSGVANLANCTISDTVTGVTVSVGATARLQNNQIFNNAVGVSVAAGGLCDTFDNNAIFGNGTDVSGVLTFRSLQ